ncbi:MAG: hypothetical protein NVSMB32_12690 [Actinomycetota bacterium]
MRWWLSFVLAGLILVGSVVLPGHPDPGATPPPPAAGQDLLTRSQALGSARSDPREPAAARLMDYRSAAGLVGIEPNPQRSPAAEVWVVTVYQPQRYTVILDGSTGAVLNSCMGCPAL